MLGMWGKYPFLDISSILKYPFLNGESSILLPFSQQNQSIKVIKTTATTKLYY